MGLKQLINLETATEGTFSATKSGPKTQRKVKKKLASWFVICKIRERSSGYQEKTNGEVEGETAAVLLLSIHEPQTYLIEEESNFILSNSRSGTFPEGWVITIICE